MSNRKSRSPKLPGHSTEAEMAAKLGVKISTLQSWRSRRLGPTYVKVARRVYYPDADFLRYLESLRCSPVRSKVA